MVSEVFHSYDAPVFPASKVSVPGQGVASEPRFTIGKGLIVTVTEFELAEQPFASTTFTEYDPLKETFIEDVFSPLLQLYDVKPVPALRVTEPPHWV